MLVNRSRRRVPPVLLLALFAACATSRPSPLKVDEGDYPHPGGNFQVRIGGGDSEVTVSDVSAGETDAIWWGLGFEGVGDVVGGGVTIDLYLSDDDQLENNNAVDSALLGLQLFPHLTIRPRAPHFRIPIRIGPAIDTHIVAVDNNVTDTTTDYVGVSIQGEIEPEVDFFRQRGGMALSVFGKVRGSVGAAFISTTPEDYETDIAGVGFEAGLRFQAAVFQIETAYVYRQSVYDLTDVADNGTTLPETEFSFNGIVIGLGVRW